MMNKVVLLSLLSLSLSLSLSSSSLSLSLSLLLLLSTFYSVLHRLRLASCYFPQHIDGRLRVQDLPQDPCCSKKSDLLKIPCVTAYFQLVQVILYIVGHRSQGAYDDWQYKYLGHFPFP